MCAEVDERALMEIQALDAIFGVHIEENDALVSLTSLTASSAPHPQQLVVRKHGFAPRAMSRQSLRTNHSPFGLTSGQHSTSSCLLAIQSSHVRHLCRQTRIVEHASMRSTTTSPSAQPSLLPTTRSAYTPSHNSWKTGT